MTINNLISRPLVQSQLILEEGYSLIGKDNEDYLSLWSIIR